MNSLLGFVWYYFANASAISERRTELRRLEQQVEQVDQQSLQRRIDSLESATTRYAEANEAVATLLKGSNRWSKGLATIAERMNDVEGLSLEQWSPEEDAEVVVAGRAADRSRVVRLARQLEGEILGITSTETRDVSLYDFQMTVPLDTTRPEAIEYWREERGERLASVDEVTQSQAPESDASASNSSTAGSLQRSSDQRESASSSGSEPGASSGTGWTVIVASLARNAAAETEAQRYRDRLSSSDHSVQIRHSPENGRYRVGIGGFSSFDDARSALREMDGTLPEDAWLLRMSGANEADTTAEGSSVEEAEQSSSSEPSKWTVVVAAHETDSLAEKTARSYRARLSDKSHSVQIRQSPDGGRYRVGIGTFSSPDSAQAARADMKPFLPADARIHEYSTTALTSGEP